MKTFNLLLGLFLGLVIGLLSVFGAIGWGLLYFVSDTGKSTGRKTGYSGPKKTTD